MLRSETFQTTLVITDLKLMGDVLLSTLHEQWTREITVISYYICGLEIGLNLIILSHIFKSVDYLYFTIKLSMEFGPHVELDTLSLSVTPVLLHLRTASSKITCH